jgi:RNA polymerase sigma factor (sigma-70 family)
MATGKAGEVIWHLRRTVLLRGEAGLTDGELLESFLGRRDEAAMEVLVRRHGPMVWGVCRRLLGNHHDAEDAFQATFLVLARRAASIASRELLANWLYGVAHQTALKARATTARRKGRERQVTDVPEPAVVDRDVWDDLRPLLDQELSRLPDKYRAVIVLCDLEGKSRKEAAGQLGCAEGTVASRLARARAMLAKRLTLRGVALSGGALAGVLTQNAASGGVPPSVVSSTVKAASLFAAGQAAGMISVKVAALTEGVLKAMLISKLRAALAVVLVLGFVATGATALTRRTAAGQDGKKPTAETPVEPAAKREKEAFTAWGKQVGGLQAGLGFRPGERRAYRHGETVTLVVRVRNVGNETVKFKYIRQFLDENPPTVTGADGKAVPQHRTDVLGFHPPVEVSLEPGKETELESRLAGGARLPGASGLRYELRPAGGGGKPTTGEQPLFVGTGKVGLQYGRVFGNSSAGSIKLDPALSRLATGRLELEIRPDPPTPANEFPAGWGGGGGKDYEIRVDRTVRHGGKASGSIKSFTRRPLWYGALTQAFKADRFRGRRLRMTAYVKSRDVENSAGLWMRVEGSDGKGNYSVSSDLMRTRIKGTTDWKQYEVVLDVPKEGAAAIYFGVMLAGKGQVWADDFKFEAVGEDVKTTGGRVETGKAPGGPLKRLPTDPRNLDFEQPSPEPEIKSDP